MMRTQPPGFRWLVGGFALVAAVAFGFRYLSSDDPADLILGALCVVVAGYWLIFDREPAAEDRAGASSTEADDDEMADHVRSGRDAAPDPGWDEPPDTKMLRRPR